MRARPRITDAQRRARLVERHGLGRTAGDVVDAVRRVVAMHSSDPVTPHLGLWGRVPGYETVHLDHALCRDRSLWRLHAMRRTLFVVPSDEGAAFEGAAGRAIARKERRKLEQWLEADMDPQEVPLWLAGVEQRTLETLAEGDDWRTAELAQAVPELARYLIVGSGTWAARVPLSSRLLFLLAMEGRVVRTRPAGSWRSSQYRWSAAATWFPRTPEPLDDAAARTALARRYLAAFGPVTTTDVRWWTGWTARQTSAALESLGALAVDLDGGAEGWVLPDDVAAAPARDTEIALLPGLDPTPMGWKEREWHLGAHAHRLFDRNGNVGPTVWVGGRVVGGWAQRPDGEVVTGLLEDVGAEASARIDEEAASLTDWLAGTVVSTRFPVPLERELSGS